MTGTCSTRGSNPIFWREWLSAPLRVGAIAPSSSALARAMIEGARIGNGDVVELGAGTGVFTRELVRVGVPPERIHAIERGTQFARLLCESMPGLRVLQGDASRLVGALWQAQLKVPLVICGLPLLSMPHRSVLRILAGSFDLIEPGGEFRLFTYGITCPVPRSILRRLGLQATARSVVFANIPPATVYALTRTGADAAQGPMNSASTRGPRRELKIDRKGTSDRTVPSFTGSQISGTAAVTGGSSGIGLECVRAHVMFRSAALPPWMQRETNLAADDDGAAPGAGRSAWSCRMACPWNTAARWLQPLLMPLSPSGPTYRR